MVLKAERMTDDEDNDGHDNDGVYLENKVDLHHVLIWAHLSLLYLLSLRRILFHRYGVQKWKTTRRTMVRYVWRLCCLVYSNLTITQTLMDFFLNWRSETFLNIEATWVSLQVSLLSWNPFSSLGPMRASPVAQQQVFYILTSRCHQSLSRGELLFSFQEKKRKPTSIRPELRGRPGEDLRWFGVNYQRVFFFTLLKKKEKCMYVFWDPEGLCCPWIRPISLVLFPR